MDFKQNCFHILNDLDLLPDAKIKELELLTGGVSSDIAVIEIGNKKVCVKCSLEQLRVDEKWEAPLQRNKAEYEWLSYVGSFLPECVPSLYGISEKYKGFAMSYFEPDENPNWKTQLMSGNVDIRFAAQLGQCLATIHQRSTELDLNKSFAYQNEFVDLRLNPYLSFTAKKYPEVEPQLNKLVQHHYNSRIALVHGDVSPKNILMGANGPIILDAECAVAGDPSFDVAFCINHLILKAMTKVANVQKLKEAIESFWKSYQESILWEQPEDLEKRLCALIPALMLARVDGKSPIEYHTTASPNTIRALSIELLKTPISTLNSLIEKICLQEINA